MKYGSAKGQEMRGRMLLGVCFFFQAEDGIRDDLVTGVQTCALPISPKLLALPAGEHRLERRARLELLAVRPYRLVFRQRQTEQQRPIVKHRTHGHIRC